MDIDSLSKGIGLVSGTIKTLNLIKDLIPSGSEKHDVEQKLKKAENDLKIAEAEIAKGFNYPLCQRHFPPGILLEITPFESKCNICGNIENY